MYAMRIRIFSKDFRIVVVNGHAFDMVKIVRNPTRRYAANMLHEIENLKSVQNIESRVTQDS